MAFEKELEGPDSLEKVISIPRSLHPHLKWWYQETNVFQIILWRILAWFLRKHVSLKDQHIPGRLNVVADKLSRLGQTIRLISPSRALPINMHQAAPASNRPFATRFNKLPHFVSPVPDFLVWAVDTLSLPWEDLDPCAFPPVAILGKVVAKLRDYPCRRITTIAPGWPNMP